MRDTAGALPVVPEAGPVMVPPPRRRSTTAAMAAGSLARTSQRSSLRTASTVSRVITVARPLRVVITTGFATGAAPFTSAGVVPGARRRVPLCSKAYASCTSRTSLNALPSSSTLAGSPSAVKPTGMAMLGRPLWAPRGQVLPGCTCPGNTGFCRTVGYAMASSWRLSRRFSMRARSAACRASVMVCAALGSAGKVSALRKRTSSSRSNCPRATISASVRTGAPGTVARYAVRSCFVSMLITLVLAMSVSNSGIATSTSVVPRARIAASAARTLSAISGSVSRK